MSGEYQLIPARHGTATFVPRGHTIMIRNTYGKQVVDTWAFALNVPPKNRKKEVKDETAGVKKKVTAKKESEKGVKDKPSEKKEEKKEERKEEEKEEAKPEKKEEKKEEKEEKKEEVKIDQNKEKADEKTEEKSDEPKVEPSEADSKDVEAAKEQVDEKAKPAEKAKWSSYLPSVPTFRSRAPAKGAKGNEDEEEAAKQANTRKWSSYLPSGKGFTSYLPSSDAMSAFASSHYRDPTKSYAEQLYDFSKTPVGAAGLSAATGSGTAGTLYAAYSAYAATLHEDDQPMEFSSMSHTRVRTKHLMPRVGDSVYSNLGNPLMTLIEDTTPGLHDTLCAACNPHMYRDFGVEKWEEHGSCSENLVLALKELNQKSGLKGARAIGAEVTVNSVPDPLNLFMNAPWQEKGDIEFQDPQSKKNQYVKFKADRDLVVVMSACPMDVVPCNGGKCMVAHFMVEVPESERPTQSRRGSGRPPTKLNRQRSSQGPQPVKERSVSFQSDIQKKKPKKLELRGTAKASS